MKLFTILPLCLLSVMASCDSSGKDKKMMEKETVITSRRSDYFFFVLFSLSPPEWCKFHRSNKPLPKYDAYFTWTNNGVCLTGNKYEPESAVYIYNGKEVGQGKAGFKQILSKLSKLPFHSSVLAYPFPEFGGSLGRPGVLPFCADWELLVEIAKERKLTIIFTCDPPVPAENSICDGKPENPVGKEKKTGGEAGSQPANRLKK